MSQETALADRIELRRFVGRELLLWLWFESELFEATLSTKEHGSFGLWLEGRLVLGEGREWTIIKGSMPGSHRDAKEALLRGKMPERAGLHLSIGGHDHALTLRGDTLGISGLSPPPQPERETPPDAPQAAPRRRGKRAAAEGDEGHTHEAFYDRMHHARDIERLIEALYRDFLALRLGPSWTATVLPALEAWARGEEVDERSYRAGRERSGLRAPRA